MIKRAFAFLLTLILTACMCVAGFAVGNNASAEDISSTEARCLVTFVCEPQIELTEYDTVILRIYHMVSGQSFAFKLYGYNNFADKFVIPVGDYLITEIALQDRPEIVLLNTKPEFTVSGVSSVIIPVTNSLVVRSATTTEATTAQETTTFYNPFVVQETDPNTSSLVGDEKETNELNNSYSVEASKGHSILLETTDEHTEDEPDALKNSSKITLILIVAVILVGVAVFVVLRRRFREE